MNYLKQLYIYFVDIMPLETEKIKVDNEAGKIIYIPFKYSNDNKEYNGLLLISIITIDKSLAIKHHIFWNGTVPPDYDEDEDIKKIYNVYLNKKVSG